MENVDLAFCNPFANKMNIHFNVFSSLMIYRVAGQVDSTSIIAINNGRFVKRAM